MKGKRTNPLLQDFDNPPFDIIKSGDYLPAFRQAIADARAELERIASNPEPPTYENTIAAIDRAGDGLERVSGIFFNLLEAEASPEMQKIAEEAVPLVTEYENHYHLHEGLFRRVKAVHDLHEPLPEEQAMLLRQVYRGFVRHGALLQGEARERYRQLTRQLSEKCLQYKIMYWLRQRNLSFTSHRSILRRWRGFRRRSCPSRRSGLSATAMRAAGRSTSPCPHTRRT